MQLFLNRKLILIAGLMAMCGVSFSQTIPAQFPGGKDSLYRYIKNKVIYPPQSYENDIQGLTVIKFKIDTNGKTNDFIEEKRIGGGCTNEIERVLRQMPSWHFAIMNQKPNPQYVVLPFIYKLDSSNSDYLIHPTIYKLTFKDTLVLDTIIFQKKMIIVEPEYDKTASISSNSVLHVKYYKNGNVISNPGKFGHLEVNGQKSQSPDSMDISSILKSDSTVRVRVFDKQKYPFTIKSTQINEGGMIDFDYISNLNSLRRVRRYSSDSLYTDYYQCGSLNEDIFVPKSIQLKQLKGLYTFNYVPITYGDPICMASNFYIPTKKYLKKKKNEK